MEIINKKSKGITGRETRSKGCFVSFHGISNGKGQLNFSKECCDKMGLEIGDELTFVADVDRLYFYKVDDGTGFNLLESKDGARLFSASLIRRLFNMYPRLKYHYRKLSVRKSVTKLNGNDLIEIQMDKKGAQRY